MITKRQKQVFDYIKLFRERKEYAPSLDEIKRQFKLASVSTAHHFVKKLREAGYLHKEDNQPRAMSPIKNKMMIEVPLLGSIAAGQPIEAIEAPNEFITVSKDEVGKYGKHYALRVEGSSMINEGIFDGDIVIIRKQEHADNGQTVVVIIDDNAATLKKIYRENNRLRLQPANPNLLPIYRKEVEIRGVVVKIIRNFETQIEKEKVKGDKFVRRIDYSWDYKGENTKSYTHGIHSYPAMFIPQVARRLIETYSHEGDTLCDIFCGSGTALVESRLLSRNSYGIDLNPFAVFLAKAKTTPIDPKRLTSAYFKIVGELEKSKDNGLKLPIFNNIDFWFKKDVVVRLAKIKRAILEINNIDIKNYFLVSFSETVRLCSNIVSSEFKLVRKKQDKLQDYNPDVYAVFKKKTETIIQLMSSYFTDVLKDVWSKVIYGDSSQDNGIKENTIDCIVTSPPYGDSRTTVAYGQFSRLSSQWLDIFDDPNKASGLDNELLGGKASKTLEHTLRSTYLNKSLDKISQADEKRAKDVLSFYTGLNDCIIRAHKLLKSKKYICLVVGNRLVKQVRIPTDFIIAELGEKIGFTCEDIFVRNIPDKRMPSKNSPTNVAGALEETMNKESIVILRKN